jgi:hypothetical protein
VLHWVKAQELLTPLDEPTILQKQKMPSPKQMGEGACYINPLPIPIVWHVSLYHPHNALTMAICTNALR